MNEMSGNNEQAWTMAPEAERAVVSACMQGPGVWLAKARQVVPGPEVFTSAPLAALWETLLELDGKSLPVDDVTTVAQRLAERGWGEKMNVPAFVTEVYTSLTITSHCETHFRTVLDKHFLRELRKAGAEIMEMAEAAGGEGLMRPVHEVVAEAESRVFGLLQEIEGNQESPGPKKVADILPDWVEKLETRIANRDKILGLTTGIHEIDLTANGFDDKNGEIVVVAGRPGQGKTTFCKTLLQHWGVANDPGVFFSAEMSADQILNGLVLGGEGVDVKKAWTGHFSHEDQDATRKGLRKVQNWPLWINDASRITTADLRIQTQTLKRKAGIRWIAVDHLHLIKGVEKASAEERMRLVEVMETLQFLKKEHKLVVLLLVQLNRETDRNAGKPPMLADLSGSAAIEQYADHVLFIHRPPYYTTWDRLPEQTRNLWEDLVVPRRARSPELWSDGRKYEHENGGAPRQDYEEDAMLFWRKNRRGPTPELHVRFEAERGLFSTRMPKAQSNNVLDWQIGSYRPEPLKREGGNGGKKWSKVKEEDDWGD
jgi:replicative DNA helicase